MGNNEAIIKEIMERSGRDDCIDESERLRIKRRVVKSKKLLERGLNDVGKAYQILEELEEMLSKSRRDVYGKGG